MKDMGMLKIFLVRCLHGIITLFFACCIVYIYYAAISGKSGRMAWLASGMIVLEGVVVVANKGNCPLGYIHKKAGDDKTFFELFLPRRVAKNAVPFLGFVAAVGIILLIIL